MIRQYWPSAKVTWDNAITQRLVYSVFDARTRAGERPPLRAFVRGTDFQVRVWRALLRIPYGALVSYGQIAENVCSHKAARAVGAAVGANRLAYLIPCHRVIRETGVFGEYRWGAERKETECRFK